MPDVTVPAPVQLAATRRLAHEDNSARVPQLTLALGDKLGILRDMSACGFPTDSVLRREAIVRDMTVERMRELAGRYLDSRTMIWLVVGDARTQRERLRGLGLGAAIRVDREGRPIAGSG